ncbi:S-layer homology domain-containing protein [Paenibacillus filicis]|uniref:S-layer homology domain-containing protein n=1 Tax=Paenibacillus gyeongsangnamensis TaxID=3388067 RepID=A0ABT4QBL8_9BACL|nr:S-layer homology domain-containing protein [Paenibacillus filicis]MCZ8514284.1 S-layer homology domain-containing protein [Paenibacillus filicis]
MNRKLLSLSLSLLMSFVYLLPQGTLAEGIPSFSLTLDNNQVTPGKEIQVTVIGNNLADVYAYEMNLDFDHTLLQFKGIQSGISGFSIDPQVDGDHLKFASTKISKVAGENGTLNLSTITFNAIGQGSAALQLKNVHLVDSQLTSQVINTAAKATALIVANGGSSGGSGNSGGNGSGSSNHAGSGSGKIDNKDGQNVQLEQGTVVVITPDVKMDTATKTATSIINKSAWEKAVQLSASNENGIKKIQIQIKEVPGAIAYVQQFPTTVLSNNRVSIQIEIVSPFAAVVIPNNMLHAGEFTSEAVGLRIGKADVSKLDKSVLNQIGDRPVIDLSMQSEGKTILWNNPEAPAAVRIPYSPNAVEKQNPEHIVVWYVAGDGQVVSVPNGRYDAKTGTVLFTTTHFSKYAVAFVQKTFDDIASLDWAKSQIEVLAFKGIVSGVSDNIFDPAQPVTRADFLVLLARTLELDRSKGMGGKFADVREGDYYDEALRIARGMGITEGVGDNLFKPHEPITREDMIVLTVRALRVAKQMTSKAKEEQLRQFNDYTAVSAYAAQSVAALVEMGLVHGYDNALHPKETTNRAQAAVLMYNIYTHFYK